MKSRFENTKKDNKGFSLVELIIAVVILGIIAVVAIGGLYSNVDKARRNTDISNARDIQSALSTLSTDKGFYAWANTTEEKKIIMMWTGAQSSASAISGCFDRNGAKDDTLVGGAYDGKKISEAIYAICPDGLPAIKSGRLFVLTITGLNGNVTVDCKAYDSYIVGGEQKPVEAAD